MSDESDNVVCPGCAGRGDVRIDPSSCERITCARCGGKGHILGVPARGDEMSDDPPTDAQKIGAMLASETGGDQKHSWFPVGCTLDEWEAKAGDFVLHQGTLLNTEHGVFVAGMIGTMFIGVKGSDGSIIRPPSCVPVSLDRDAVIIEAADQEYGNGCHRDRATQAIVCRCPDDW